MQKSEWSNLHLVSLSLAVVLEGEETKARHRDQLSQ